VDERELQRCLSETLQAVRGQEFDLSAPGIHLTYSARGKTILEKDHGCEEVTRLWHWRRIPWPTAAEAAGISEPEEEEDWRVLAALAGVCGLLGLIGFLLDRWAIGPVWLAPVIYLASMIAGGWDAAKDAIPNMRRGHLDIHFLMLAVAAGASLIGAFGEGALLLFLFSLAGALEHFALHRTKREIEALFHLAPKTAIRIDPSSGVEEPVPVEQIGQGDLLLVRPGDTFPVDGVLTQGETEVDESSLTERLAR
jgi:Zn2+/Cd2+-exporting ATPase